MACKYFHVVNTVTVNADTSVVLNFVSPVTASDKDRFCFKVVTDIPSSAATLPVLLTVNGVSTVALWNKYGNPVVGSDLSSGKCYRGYFGATTPHVITRDLPSVVNCNCGV